MTPSHGGNLFGWTGPGRALLILAVGLSGSVLGWMSLAVPSGALEFPELSVDANTVPQPVLGALPGLGPALSGRIVEARPLASLDDLDRRVKGIGPAKAAAIRPFLRFNSPSPTRVP
jgi:DNA uptake protein ComE-like DNA-binding protein